MKIFKLNKLTPLQRRFLTFILGCVGVRLLLVHAVRKAKKEYLPVLGYLGLFVALGFCFTYFSGKERGSTFGQKAWWHKLRLVHAFFYFWFARLAFQKKRNSYIPLLFDVTFGLTSFLVHHISIGSFRKLL